MTETIPFTQSWGFYVILFFAGVIVGWFVCALCCISSRASRDEERWESGIIMSEIADIMNKPIKQVPITEGKPDRE